MKSTLDSLADVPEALHSEYEEREGKFHVKLEGDPHGYVKASLYADANGKVVKFRNGYTELLKEVAVLAGVSEATDLAPIKAKLATFEGVDPSEYKELKAKAEELRKKGVKTPEDIQAQIKAALDSAIAPLREELASEKKGRVEAQGRANEALLKQSIGTKYLKVGGKPNALDFIVTQAKDSFHVVDDAVKALDTKFSIADPGQPLEVDEWLTQAMKDYDFAFGESKGGGADPKPGSNGKPGAKILRNPTPQELGENADDIRSGAVQILND